VSNNKNYILFIGMGDWYVPNLRVAKKYKFKTIVTNKNPKAEALRRADVPIIADGNDANAILEAIFEKDLENSILFVNTGTELFTSTAIVARSLGLSWHTPKGSYICQRKHLMKKHFIEKDVPTPLGFSVKTYSQFKEMKKSLGKTNDNFQWIFKPSDGLSAYGVSISKNIDTEHESFEFALQHSHVQRVICERYIYGSLHDVNGIIADDKFYRLGINDKKAGLPPNAVVIEGSAPTTLTVGEQDFLYKIFEDACRAVGLDQGPVKGDCIRSSDGKLYMMEVAARLHGPLGSIYLIPHSLDIVPFEELIHFYSGNKVQTHNTNIKNTRSVLVEALESPPKADNDSIAVLEKMGSNDHKKWQSNNDVPVYRVKYD
jgi:biotin carboxylase